jgi:hypothetical protein
MNNEKVRDSFVFYRSFFQSTKRLTKEDKAELFEAICSYALDGESIEMSAVPDAIFSVIKPNLDANRRKWENGCKEKKKISKTEASEEHKISKTEAKDKQNGSKTEGNDNVNVNVNENVNEEIKPYPQQTLFKNSDEFSIFCEIYQKFYSEKKIRSFPYDKLKNRFKSCISELGSVSALEEQVKNYLAYLSIADWRHKKEFGAWINDKQCYANDWASDMSSELKRQKASTPTKPKSAADHWREVENDLDRKFSQDFERDVTPSTLTTIES